LSIIKQPSRTSRRGIFVALAVAVCSLSIVGTAQAADLNVRLFCEGVGNYQISCETEISGGTAPYAIKWYSRGLYIPWWDNRQTILESCERGSWNGHKVVVADATGITRESSSLARCYAIAP